MKLVLQNIRKHSPNSAIVTLRLIVTNRKFVMLTELQRGLHYPYYHLYAGKSKIILSSQSYKPRRPRG